jgi:hypothetical protein
MERVMPVLPLMLRFVDISTAVASGTAIMAARCFVSAKPTAESNRPSCERQEAHAMERGEFSSALCSAARDRCLGAVQEARTLAMATGNGRPLELAERIAASIEDAEVEMQS